MTEDEQALEIERRKKVWRKEDVELAQKAGIIDWLSDNAKKVIPLFTAIGLFSAFLGSFTAKAFADARQRVENQQREERMQNLERNSREGAVWRSKVDRVLLNLGDTQDQMVYLTCTNAHPRPYFCEKVRRRILERADSAEVGP